MNITKLNKQFLPYTVLTAAELNAVTGKIDEIIDNWPSVTLPDDDTPGEGSDDSDILDEINDAKAWISGKISELQELIAQYEAEHTLEDEEDHFLNLFKGDNGKAALMYYGLVGADGHPTFNILLDEHGVVTPAAIIANITDQNGKLSSQIGISANNIILDGNVTLTNKLSAIEGTISNLNVPDTATIKNAVIQDLTTNDLTITGTLHYNKIIGNVTTVSLDMTLSDDAYFVLITNQDSNNHINVALPSNPSTGQTVFIGGTKYYNLRANAPINIYYDYIDESQNYKHSVLAATISSGSYANAFTSGWNGYVEFIYTGSAWLQLIHNIYIP